MNYLRINKRKAKKLFNDGITIYITPGGAQTNGPWIFAAPFNISDHSMEDWEFDKIINHYEYYNCHYPFFPYAWYYLENTLENFKLIS